MVAYFFDLRTKALDDALQGSYRDLVEYYLCFGDILHSPRLPVSMLKRQTTGAHVFTIFAKPIGFGFDLV